MPFWIGITHTKFNEFSPHLLLILYMHQFWIIRFKWRQQKLAKLNKIKQRKFNFIFHFLIICVTMSFHILQCSNASRFQTATIHQCVELHFMHIRYMTHGYPLHGPFRSIVQSLRRRIFCLSSKLSLEERALWWDKQTRTSERDDKYKRYDTNTKRISSVSKSV